jgi:hypothetical protein
MTYRSDCSLPDEPLELIADQGLDVLPELIRTVINAAMHIERQDHLGVGPYERSPERAHVRLHPAHVGQAGAFRPRNVQHGCRMVQPDDPCTILGERRGDSSCATGHLQHGFAAWLHPPGQPLVKGHLTRPVRHGDIIELGQPPWNRLIHLPSISCPRRRGRLCPSSSPSTLFLLRPPA